LKAFSVCFAWLCD